MEDLLVPGYDTGLLVREVELDSCSNMCANFSAHELKPPPLSEIKLWGCEEYQASVPVIQASIETVFLLLTIFLMIILSLESIRWVPPPRKWIIHPCLDGQKPKGSNRMYLETLEINHTYTSLLISRYFSGITWYHSCVILLYVIVSLAC